MAAKTRKPATKQPEPAKISAEYRPMIPAPAGAVVVMDFGTEGEGDTIYGRQGPKGWSFWSSRSRGVDDVDLSSESKPTAQLADHLPPQWHWTYVLYVHPEFVQSVAPLYLGACAAMPASKDREDLRYLDERWRRKLGL